jgi:hypothetical protein
MILISYQGFARVSIQIGQDRRTDSLNPISDTKLLENYPANPVRKEVGLKKSGRRGEFPWKRYGILE